MKVEMSFANFVVQPQKVSVDPSWKKIGLIAFSVIFNVVTLGIPNIILRRCYPEKLAEKVDYVAQTKIGVQKDDSELDVEKLIGTNKEELNITEIPEEESALVKYLQTTFPIEKEKTENAEGFAEKGTKIDEKFFKTVLDIKKEGANVGDYEKKFVEGSFYKIKVKLDEGKSLEIVLKKSSLSTKDKKLYRMVVSDGKKTSWSTVAFTVPQISTMLRLLKNRPEGYTLSKASFATLPVSGLVILKNKENQKYYVVNEKGVLQQVEDLESLGQHVNGCIQELGKRNQK